MAATNSATEHAAIVADVMRNSLHIVASLDLIGGLDDAPRAKPTQSEILEAIAECGALRADSRAAIRKSVDAQAESERAESSMSGGDREDLEALLAIIAGSSSLVGLEKNLATAERVLAGRPVTGAIVGVRDMIAAGRGVIYDDSVTLLSPREAGATGRLRGVVYASQSPVTDDAHAYVKAFAITRSVGLSTSAAAGASAAAVVRSVIEWLIE